MSDTITHPTNFEAEQQPEVQSPIKLKSQGGKRQQKKSSMKDTSLNSTRNSERDSMGSNRSAAGADNLQDQPIVNSQAASQQTSKKRKLNEMQFEEEAPQGSKRSAKRLKRDGETKTDEEGAEE